MKEGKYEEKFFQGLAELEFCSGRWIETNLVGERKFMDWVPDGREGK